MPTLFSLVLLEAIKMTTSSAFSDDKETLLGQKVVIMEIMENNVHGLVQDCSNSIALAMELLQSSTKPSRCDLILN